MTRHDQDSGVTNRTLSVVMTGATGAVGGEVVRTLATMPDVERVTLLGRREFRGVSDPKIGSSVVDLGDPASYTSLLPGHEAAICTVGVGQPTKVSKEEFVRIDKDLVLAFAVACKEAGVRHFPDAGIGGRERPIPFVLPTDQGGVGGRTARPRFRPLERVSPLDDPDPDEPIWPLASRGPLRYGRA